MDPIKNIKLRWLHGALHDITYELSRSQFSRFAPHAWEPAINAYRCETCIRICVDLAGVERSLIDLTVEPRRVVIRGRRELPEPTHAEEHTRRFLGMEVDYGPVRKLCPLAERPRSYSSFCARGRKTCWSPCKPCAASPFAKSSQPRRFCAPKSICPSPSSRHKARNGKQPSGTCAIRLRDCLNC